jgi:glycosyltransferase involved in cell wall biosynthesis
LSTPRPAVGVVVPFRGDRSAALQMLAALERLQLRDGDELIIADNTADGVVAAELAAAHRTIPSVSTRGSYAPPNQDGRNQTPKVVRPRIVHAARESSSYHARNAGARAAGGEWLLFMDADCVPAPDLLDAHLAPAPGDRVGALAGTIAGATDQTGLIARYTRSRRFFDQHQGLHTKAGGAATANLMVRREAFEGVGGFVEGIRSGGDVELSWRLQAAGWELNQRPGAVVEHRHREGLMGLMAAIARYGAGSRWLNERHPGSSPRWPLSRALAGALADALANGARGRREAATFRAIDGLGLIAHNAGYRSSNAARRRGSKSRLGPV